MTISSFFPNDGYLALCTDEDGLVYVLPLIGWAVVDIDGENRIEGVVAEQETRFVSQINDFVRYIPKGADSSQYLDEISIHIDYLRYKNGANE